MVLSWLKIRFNSPNLALKAVNGLAPLISLRDCGCLPGHIQWIQGWEYNLAGPASLLTFFFFPIETKRRERLENVGSFRFLEKDRLRKCSYFGEQKRRRWRDCASLRGYLSCCCYLRLQILSYSFQCIAFPPTYVSSGWGSVICNQESYSTGPNLPFQSYLQLLTFLNP